MCNVDSSIGMLVSYFHSPVAGGLSLKGSAISSRAVDHHVFHPPPLSPNQYDKWQQQRSPGLLRFPGQVT